MSKYSNLKKEIKKNEGFRNIFYLDILGYKTIGYGHLIKKQEKELLKKNISKKKLLNIFDIDFKKAETDFKKNYSNYNFSKKIEEVLIEMIFQLGIKKQKKFIKMLKYLSKNELHMAALEMKKSLWYIQTPNRVELLIKKMLK